MGKVNTTIHFCFNMEKLKTKDSSYIYKGQLYAHNPSSIKGEVIRVLNDKDVNFCRKLKYKESETIDKGESIVDDIPVLNWFRNRYETKYNSLKKIPTSIQIMNVDKAQSLFFPSWLGRLFGAANVKLNKEQINEGDILFKHPFFPNTYVDDISEVTLFKDRISCISALAGKLGASKVEGHAIWNGTSKRSLNVSGEVQYQVYELDASFRSKEKEKYSREFVLSDTFGGGTPDIAEAERYAKEVGLIKNNDIQNLIEVRKGKNPIKSRHIKISLSDEIENLKSLAFKFSVIPIFSLNGKFKETCEKSTNVDFEFTIEF